MSGFAKGPGTALPRPWRRSYPLLEQYADKALAGWSPGLGAKWPPACTHRPDRYQRDLEDHRYVYWLVDGVYSNVRLDDCLCLLVIIGVTEHGCKNLVAVEDGHRKSQATWTELLTGQRERGLTEAPRLAVGDGALGFWKALTKVYPATPHQSCWVHKAAQSLLSGNAAIDGIFCANDLHTFAAMDVARYRCGLRVPEDLGIIGFDDIEQAGADAYQLTTIHQPIDEMVRHTADLVTNPATSSQEVKAYLFPCSLSKRASLLPPDHQG